MMAALPLAIVWRLTFSAYQVGVAGVMVASCYCLDVGISAYHVGEGLWWPAGFLLLSGGWHLCRSHGWGWELWWPAGLLLLSGGWHLCLSHGWGWELWWSPCLLLLSGGWFPLPITWAWRGVMVAALPLVIVWMLASVPITWLASLWKSTCAYFTDNLC